MQTTVETHREAHRQAHRRGPARRVREGSRPDLPVHREPGEDPRLPQGQGARSRSSTPRSGATSCCEEFRRARRARVLPRGRPRARTSRRSRDPEIDLEQAEPTASRSIFTATVEVRPRLELDGGRLQGRQGRRSPRVDGHRGRGRRVGRAAARAVRRARAGRAAGEPRATSSPSTSRRHARRRGVDALTRTTTSTSSAPGEFGADLDARAPRHEARRHPRGVEDDAARAARRGARRQDRRPSGCW